MNGLEMELKCVNVKNLLEKVEMRERADLVTSAISFDKNYSS